MPISPDHTAPLASTPSKKGRYHEDGTGNLANPQAQGRCRMKPAPTSYSILCNVAQRVQGYLELPPDGLVDTVTIPRAHLRRWLELVHSAVMLLDAPLAAARGLVRWLLAGGGWALGWLGGWALS